MKVYPVFLLSLLTAAHSSTFSAYGAAAEPIAFPIKAAEGKHTFADAKGNPFFWLGTTQWELFQSLFATGAKTEGQVLRLAARHRDGQWAMFYLGDQAEFSVNLGKLSATKLNASWINPAHGKVTPLGLFPNQGVKSFTTPEGWEDSLLVLESPDAQAKSP